MPPLSMGFLRRCLGLSLLFFTATEAFVTVPSHRHCSGKGLAEQPPAVPSSALQMGGFFDGIQNFFSEYGSGDNHDSNNNGNSEDDYATENRVVTIPVRAIKPGGLRLFLMFYLMGMQNTPHRNAWKADQPSREDYVIDFYFHDRTAMLTIELQEDEITIDRIGSVPSTAYSMQETVIVEGLLDELHQCAFDESIDEENRLLQLSEPKDAIEQARTALSFG
ncbi:expressed unknown protein [Seminavis robusta]|uniref:Uncharacterized protein n=1 Tax=Seminavis robusta TaxID=568900 RepID=A0A9N8HFF3_9STRA|nr:expressed unknown protein [Seminavis robusta]|eukprot:Sro521_g159430.1 n/a (221) ;mRNA; f:44502-45286